MRYPRIPLMVLASKTRSESEFKSSSLAESAYGFGKLLVLWYQFFSEKCLLRCEHTSVPPERGTSGVTCWLRRQRSGNFEAGGTSLCQRFLYPPAVQKEGLKCHLLPASPYRLVELTFPLGTSYNE